MSHDVSAIEAFLYQVRDLNTDLKEVREGAM